MINQFHFWNRSSAKVEVSVHHDGCAMMPWADNKPKCWDSHLEPGRKTTFIGNPEDLGALAGEFTPAMIAQMLGHPEKLNALAARLPGLFQTTETTQTAVYRPSRWVTDFTTWLGIIVSTTVSLALIGLTGGAAAPEVIAADVAGAEAMAGATLSVMEAEAIAEASLASRLIALCEQFAADYPRVVATAQLIGGATVGFAIAETAETMGLHDWKIFARKDGEPVHVPTSFMFQGGSAYFIIEDEWNTDMWRQS